MLKQTPTVVPLPVPSDVTSHAPSVSRPQHDTKLTPDKNNSNGPDVTKEQAWTGSNEEARPQTGHVRPESGTARPKSGIVRPLSGESGISVSSGRWNGSPAKTIGKAIKQSNWLSDNFDNSNTTGKVMLSDINL